MSRYSEREIATVVLEIIRSHPGLHTSQLISEARRIMQPSGEDCIILDNRNDDKFSQQVRNIKSHDSSANLVRTIGTRDRQWCPK